VRIFHWSLVAGFAANALLTDDDSPLHEWVGYAVVALVALRLIWGLVGPLRARFASFTPSPATAMAQMQDIATGRRSVHLGHTPLGALMVFNLLAVMLAIGATGYMMTADAWWGVEWVEEAHEMLVVGAEISIVLHIAAVMFESVRTGVNLPRAMVKGVKMVPSDAKIIE